MTHFTSKLSRIRLSGDTGDLLLRHDAGTIFAEYLQNNREQEKDRSFTSSRDGLQKLGAGKTKKSQEMDTTNK